MSDTRARPGNAQWVARMVADAEVALVGTDRDGIIASWNRAAERLLGYSADEAVGVDLALIDAAAADRLRRALNGACASTSCRCRIKGGGTVALCVTAWPVRDDAGDMLGAAMALRDMTQCDMTLCDIAGRGTTGRRPPESRSPELAEMHHAIRNLFTLASSVVSLSARFAPTPLELARQVRGRLVALSRATDLRIAAGGASGWAARGDVGLHALVRALVESHAAADGGRERLRVSGPDLAIPGSSVTHFALLLDALAGKAVQHGALSHARGGISVETAIGPAGLVLQWREHGGARPAGGPLREGAGSRFIRTIATRHLGGAMTRRWAGDGLMVRLVVPLARLQR